MSGWLDLAQLGLAPNQKHQALLGAPKIVHMLNFLVLRQLQIKVFDDTDREFKTLRIAFQFQR
jgi:hypothetical protein